MSRIQSSGITLIILEIFLWTVRPSTSPIYSSAQWEYSIGFFCGAAVGIFSGKYLALKDNSEAANDHR
jgi:hypothetical protein